jgi:hypothetical protein
MSEQPSASNLSEPQSFDAQQIVEDIAAGEQKAPEVDVSQDYEASKELDTSQSDQGTSAAATKSDSPGSGATGSPTDFLGMAKEISSGAESQEDSATS